MKKQFIFSLFLLLLINIGYSQNSKGEISEYSLCNNCNGLGVIKIEKWVKCNNCKSYNEEIKDAIQESLALAIIETATRANLHLTPTKWCNVCNNKKGKNEIIKYECRRCGGMGKIRNSYFPTKQKEVEIASGSITADKNLWIKLKLKERETKKRKENYNWKPGTREYQLQKEGKLKELNALITNRGSFGDH
jgi:DnaJ-class molecular chaperone